MRKFTDNDILLPSEIGGVRFRNPFYVASGPTTMTVEQLQRIEETGWGGASLKLSFDPDPYINRHPRYGYWEEEGLLSFTTEKRLLFKEECRLIEEGRKRTSKIVLLSNFTYDGDKGVEGWVNMARRYEEAGAHINEINMCCPNMSFNVELSCNDDNCLTSKTGASLGQDAEAVGEIVAAIKDATAIPLFVKLTPEGGMIAKVAEACYAAGADAVGTTANRLAITHVDLENPGKSPYKLVEEVSLQCMCNKWVHPLGLRDVYEIRKLNGPEVKIVGAGGVHDWRSAAEMVLCGANFIGICAETLVSGFNFFPDLIINFKEWLKRQNYEGVDAATNVIPPQIKSASEITIYDGKAKVLDNNLSAPCVFYCPASVPAQAYISKIAEGEFKEGYEILTAETPLMSVCAWVCDHPCEDACTRTEKDEALRIRDLKRFLIEKAKQEGWTAKKSREETNGKSIAVVGSGPSGLAAANILSRAGYRVDIYEAEEKAGGMLRWGLPDFRSPKDILDDEVKNLQDLGVRFFFNKTLGKDISLQELKATYDAVYIAVGANKAVEPGIKGSRGPGVISATGFLNQIAKKNIPDLKDKRAVVIGGGYTAIDSARTCLRLGAKEVYVIYRRGREEMPCSEEEVEEAEEEGIKILYYASPVEINRDGQSVRSILLQTHVLGDEDSSGRRRPEAVPAAAYKMDTDYIIYALGQKVSLEDDITLDLDNERTIVVDNEGRTGTAGVYAGGDAVLGAATVIEAIASAKNTAAAIDHDLMGAEAVLSPLPPKSMVDIENVLQRNGKDKRRWRVPLPLTPAEERKKTFDTYVPVLSDAEAVKEAARCYRCGCGEGCMICHDICKMFAFHKEGTKVVLDDEKCVACGMCAWRCPNDNIEIIRTSEEPI